MPNHVYGNIRKVVPMNTPGDRREVIEKELTEQGYTDFEWKERQLLLSMGNEAYFTCIWAKLEGVQHYFVDSGVFGYTYYVVNEEDD